MASKKMTQRIYVIFGLSMAALMVLSAILPSIAQNMNQQVVQPNEPIPTETPVPRPFPQPLSDYSTITFTEDYLHPSGLFYITVPSGWAVGASPINNARQAQVSLNNSDLLTVIEMYVERPSTPVSNREEVSALYTTGILASSWNRYDRWSEAGARRYADDRVVIDFILARGGQNFLAQHIAWTDGTWVYVVRVVTPDNARDFLYWLSNEMLSHFHILEQFKTAPMGWTAFHDRRTNTILRYPNGWRVLDGGGAGRPITVGIDDGTAIVASTIDAQVADETAARDFVLGLRRNVDVVSVNEISRPGASGFSVAYRFATPDGEERSALAILLNGADGKLHTAIGQISRGGVDLNSPEGRAQFFDLTTALDSFSLLMGLNLPALPEPTPTPTRPAPTATPEIEPTPEGTPEA